MAMKTLYFKEHEGLVHNPIGQLSSIPSVPWWGSQSAYGDSCGQLKSLSVDQPSGAHQVTIATKQASRSTEEELYKRNTTTQFNIFPGDCKGSAEGPKPAQAFFSLQTALPEYRSHFDLGFGQPTIHGKYPFADPCQCHGVFSTYESQISGRIMLPMNLTTDDGPIYVNAKQYHGIMRRRRYRAKAALENRLTKNRKPYMHRSRHLHAMRRPRGSGGRFLNTKSLENGKCGIEAKKIGDNQLSQPTGSQNSEVLQSDSGTLNSSKEAIAGGSNITGSEVTSMYSRGDIDRSSINHLASSFHAFSGMIDAGHDIVMSSKWVAAADNCCNLKV